MLLAFSEGLSNTVKKLFGQGNICYLNMVMKVKQQTKEKRFLKCKAGGAHRREHTANHHVSERFTADSHLNLLYL